MRTKTTPVPVASPLPFYPMRILLLSQWYAPEPETRIHSLARGLLAKGHQVTSITGLPNYPHGRLYPGYQQRWWQWEEREGVRVLRLPLYPDHSQRVVKRSLNYLSFAASASLLGPALGGRADVLWVYHPPLTVGWPAWWMSRLRRVPFVYEIQDMWPETLLATGMVADGRARRLLDGLARFVYRQAAAITVISPGFKRNLVGKGVPADKIHVLPNWADEETYRPLPPDPRLAEEYGLAGRFNVIYGGNLGAAQALTNVLEAAVRLGDLPHVQFVLIGDGVEEARLQEQAAAMGLDNVRFVGRQPGERMPHFFALADALLIHLRRDPLFEITIPSKTVAYLACGRPMVAAVAGDAAEVVQQAGAGVICPPENPEALAAAVRQLATMPVETREAMGRDGRCFFLAHFTRQVLLERYEQLLMEVAGIERKA
ncbi:MAG: glycosyltransferase family 4 protein [Chloroflexota bacterium]